MNEPNYTAHAPESEASGPEMSTPETLGNIFFDPSTTFDALRRRPRFLVAGLLIMLISVVVTTVLFNRIDFDSFMRSQIDKSPRAEQMTEQQKQTSITVGKTLARVSPVFAIFVFAAGAGLYMLGAMLLGGKMSYKQSLAVWVYSSLPPAVLTGALAVVMMFVKSADDIDLNKPGGGLLQTNLAVLLGPDSSPVMRSLLGSFDIFAFYGMFLAAIGLRRVARLSSGSAWALVIGLWVIVVLCKVIWAALFGR